MYCTNCGSKLSDSAKFCPYCGQMQEAHSQPQQTVHSAPVQPVMQDSKQAHGATATAENDPQKSDRALDILVKGILSLAFGNSGFLAIVGIIFGVIGKKSVQSYEADYGEASGKARVGKYLSIAGFYYSLYVSIMLTIVFAFYLFFFLNFLILILTGNLI